MDLAALQDFYLARSEDGEHLYDIWERGAGRGDSVTPSSFSEEYRQWMFGKLDGLLTAGRGGLISIGCGNAMIEARLVEAGHRVLAVDAIQEAVDLARDKGIEAVQADATAWTPPPGPWTVVYADGVFGYLYSPQDGLRGALEHMRTWLLPMEGTLVVSNDHTRSPMDAEPAPGIPGFHWLSGELLRKESAAAGFHEVSCTTFDYQRPLSGTRTRVILTARA